MSLYTTLARPLLFQLDPEVAHHLTPHFASPYSPSSSPWVEKHPAIPHDSSTFRFGTASESPRASIKMRRQPSLGAILGSALRNWAR
ncbi:hypothetical protein EBS57_07420 [bacterium]|nr:hypothetical protein [bacterium]